MKPCFSCIKRFLLPTLFAYPRRKCVLQVASGSNTFAQFAPPHLPLKKQIE
jgi:hypothetical protein